MCGCLLKHKRLWLFATFPALVGSVIYIFWRPDSLIMFQWVSFFGLSALVNSIRRVAASVAKLLPCWVIFSLPNALWIFSYTIIVSAFWKTEKKGVERTVWLLSPIILGTGYELMQLVQVIPGTFCLFDLAFVLGGTLLGYKAGVINLKEVIQDEKGRSEVPGFASSVRSIPGDGMGEQ